MNAGRIASQALGGALLVNAVPHGVSGVQGRRFPTPFARPPARGLSSAATNVLWAAASALAGAALLRRGSSATAERIAALGGAVTMGVLLAVWFERVLGTSR